MSELTAPRRPAWHYAAYAAFVAVAIAETAVLWLALHPHVPESYRAYYINRTTTCLDQPVAGTYTVGEIVDFTSNGRQEQWRPLRVCGWEGPAGDGTHAVGESSRLRFVYPSTETPLTLKLDLVAVDNARNGQPIDVVIDGETVETVRVNPGTPQPFAIALPADLTADGRVELELAFPEAIQPGTEINTRKRSIKLLAAGLTPN